MPHDHNSLQIDRVEFHDVTEKIHRVNHVFESHGPASARSYSSVFHVPGRKPGLCQRVTKVAGMSHVMFLFPETTVDHNHDWPWPRDVRVTEVPILKFFCNIAIWNAPICQWRDKIRVYDPQIFMILMH